MAVQGDVTYSLILGCETEGRLVEETGDLDVCWRFNELANEFPAHGFMSAHFICKMQ